ncbi:hypothetical protein Tco_0366109 [Tanacetum coccineum]
MKSYCTYGGGFDPLPSYGNLYANDRYFSFGRHLDELHVTWAHLEKKQTRLRTNTKTLEDLCSQSLETASQAIHNAVTTHQVPDIDKKTKTRPNRKKTSTRMERA